MKPTIAITFSVLSAAATMSHAGVEMNVVSKKVSGESKAATKALLERHDFANLMESNIESLSVALKMDEKPFVIDVKSLLAVVNGADSTTRNTYNPAGTSCYSNCYSNCHGSRGWR